jgi:hypothetical protein
VKDGNGKEVAKDGKWAKRMEQRWLAGSMGVSGRGDKLWALNFDGRDDSPSSSRPWRHIR